MNYVLLRSTSVKMFNVFSDLKKAFKKIKRITKNTFCKGIVHVHTYSNYEDYLNTQKEKTTDLKKFKSWIGTEWNTKLNGFKEVFMRNKVYVANKKNAICLGSRTGQEVKALIDMGIQAIGIDLVPFPPYTIKGDIHNINYPDTTFDLVFTNIFDHALYPAQFCQEIERITQSNGIIIIHLLISDDFDKYAAIQVNNPSSVVALFKKIKVIHSKEIKNGFDSLNWELILKKI